MRVPLPETSAIEPSRLCTTTATLVVAERDLEHAVGAEAERGVAEQPRARRRERPGRPLDDQEVVPERLPLRDAHGRNGSFQRVCEEAGERRGDLRDRLAVDPLARLVRLVRLARPVVDGRDAVRLQRGDVRPGLLREHRTPVSARKRASTGSDRRGGAAGLSSIQVSSPSPGDEIARSRAARPRPRGRGRSAR